MSQLDPEETFFLILILTSVFLCAETNSQVFQPLELQFTEGETAEIRCNHSITGNSGLFWYQHLPGRFPELLTSGVLTAKDVGRFSMPIAKDRMSTSLVIRGVEVGDAALYYCAVNQGNNKLTFGEGTTLIVKPNIKNSAPSAYVLKPAAGSEDQVGTACLVTDFSPAGNVTVYLNETEKGVRPATLVESEKKWSYGIVEWSPKKQDDQFKCRAEYKGQTIEAQEWKEDTQKSCSVISVSEYFETDEKLNTLSLTVLGLKIVFMKSIAFNLLMTLRLWTS